MHVDPNSPTATLTKRQLEVLDRLEQGVPVKRIAADIGVSRNAVYQTIDRLRRQGALPEAYTPSGQPPRRVPEVGAAAFGPATIAPRESSLAEMRRHAAAGEGDTAGYAALIEQAIATGDVAVLAYELGRLDAGAADGLPAELVHSALRRLGVLPVEGE